MSLGFLFSFSCFQIRVTPRTSLLFPFPGPVIQYDRWVGFLHIDSRHPKSSNVFFLNFFFLRMISHFFVPRLPIIVNPGWPRVLSAPRSLWSAEPVGMGDHILQRIPWGPSSPGIHHSMGPIIPHLWMGPQNAAESKLPKWLIVKIFPSSIFLRRWAINQQRDVLIHICYVSKARFQKKIKSPADPTAYRVFPLFSLLSGPSFCPCFPPRNTFVSGACAVGTIFVRNRHTHPSFQLFIWLDICSITNNLWVISVNCKQLKL